MVTPGAFLPEVQQMLTLPRLPARQRSETLERMNRVAFSRVFSLVVLALPLAVQAQAFRCTDPATGRVLYTDQPCAGGDLVVPALTEEEQERRRLAESEALARRAAERQQALEAERLQLERERLELERSAVQAAQPPQESSACRQARENAEQVAASRTSSAEQIRTARYNAALACGQQPPAEVVETTTVVRQPYYNGGYYGRGTYYTSPSYGGYVSGRSGSVNWGVGFGSGGAYGTPVARPAQRPAPSFARPPQPQQPLRMNVPGTASLRVPRQNNSAIEPIPVRVNP